MSLLLMGMGWGRVLGRAPVRGILSKKRPPEAAAEQLYRHMMLLGTGGRLGANGDVDHRDATRGCQDDAIGGGL